MRESHIVLPLDLDINVKLHLCDKPMQWVNSVKYLGITLMSSKKIALDLNQVKRKFFGCVNLIMNHSCGMSDMVKLHLVESYCYPVLSYALECFNITSTHMQQLSAAGGCGRPSATETSPQSGNGRTGGGYTPVAVASHDSAPKPPSIPRHRPGTGGRH